jgi:hypothetical protein
MTGLRSSSAAETPDRVAVMQRRAYLIMTAMVVVSLASAVGAVSEVAAPGGSATLAIVQAVISVAAGVVAVLIWRDRNRGAQP